MSHLVSQSDYSLLPYIKGTDHNDEFSLDAVQGGSD